MNSYYAMFICLSLALPGTLLAGNTLDMAGNPTATPLVAFSLRKLSSAYTGHAIQVRRSSDGTTQNIDFTAAGDLDTATLKAFAGSGTGYVTCWYDQSGNGYNATQTTAANQPTVMIGGVINRDNGRPSLYTSITGFLSYGPVTQLSGTKPVTRMEVCRSRDTGSLAITEGLGNFQLDLEIFPAQLWVQFEDGNITADAAVSNTTSLMSINSVRNNGASQLYVNTVLLGSTASPLLTLSAPVTGYVGVRFDYATGNSSGPGAFSETILFNSVLADPDRQSINYNEHWYYALGFPPCSSTRAALSPDGTTTKALYACTLNTWAYYYDPAHPLNLLFGIAKDPGSSGANPGFVADSVDLTTTSDPATSTIGYLAATDGIFALGRYWNVYTHTPLSSPVNIRFFYNPPDTALIYSSALSYKNILNLSLMSGLLWFKTVGDPFSYDSLAATPIATLKGPFVYLTPVYGAMNGINYAEFDGVTSFSGVSGGTGVYIVSNTMVTLPVVISSLSGRCVNNAVLLNWTTQSGSNNLAFDIQRSADGSTWEQIGRVSATGNGSTTTSYNFTDASPLSSPANNYYRLRMADADGRDVYSGVVLVSMCDGTGAAPQGVKVVPNPFASEMEITCTVPGSAPVEVRIQDMTGATLLRQKYTATKGINVFSLTNLNNLAKGTYVVLVVQEGVVGIGKVIKE